MKQSELNRELGRVAKAAAKKRGWKCIAGMPYWTIGPLFFVCIPIARAKGGMFRASPRFKWLSLDRLLWRILGMSSNEDQPPSLHARGAFVLQGQEVLALDRSGLTWGPGVIQEEVERAAELCARKADEVSAQVTSIQSYLEFIRRGHESHMARYPRSAMNIWKEELLVALESGDVRTAATIARTRIAAGDSGGFLVGRSSFYECALALNGP